MRRQRDFGIERGRASATKSTGVGTDKASNLVEVQTSRNSELERLGWVLAVGSLLAVGYGLIGFPFAVDQGKLLEQGLFADVIHEQATAWEALYGDPYRPVGEIMADHGLAGFDFPISVRTPAALLVQMPLLLIPQDKLLLTVTPLVIALVLVAFRVSFAASGKEWLRAIWFAPALAISFPVFTAVSYGSVTVVLTTALVVTAWAFRDRPWAGALLGLAIGVRLWPALVVFGFWIEGRRRAAGVAVATFLAVTAGGLMLPRLSLAGTFRSVAEGGVDWQGHTQNLSLSSFLSTLGLPLIGAVVLISSLGILLASRRPDCAIHTTTVVALLASPLTWPAYVFTAMPAFANIGRSGHRFQGAISAAPFVAWAVLPMRALAVLMCLGLVALLVATNFSSRGSRCFPSESSKCLGGS